MHAQSGNPPRNNSRKPFLRTSGSNRQKKDENCKKGLRIASN